ncbi:copper-translocating P-type ATPase [Lactobacillus delbrueckii subsp. lactis DSM 20072]|uniref:heavy metal translocating P-type ATPase n=1 Tax=Lactobacillus delbrueckii TaxID=1584 RepID=UPI000202FD6C|nr:heavy metal translocating P-type ATPase [Lactobacillus delbrueckii]ASW11563.1 copper-translocating P-type ATPase [Lactobacillus delbrueckii subsp. lactis DSM 20072]EGD26813.1 heavy-metal transporting ATPase ZntA [Lactobacillus delbrueckii subsp. lactis DSM 20072]KRK66860.1 heavy-metal transporting atpase znta [Lactobacillus delbrueckii subsp. lactis DSM 20072]MCD5440587.1 heavy metal translocating P-type ATPase [Lactobacillus delbrueckii subsp. lactis]MCD5484250.1 heavy metal translocating 
MQKWLMKNRNRLTAITGILIVLAFAAKWLFKSETAESGLLLAASLIGGFPIAASAWQALKVKVISIDLLVTLAILGAFVIQEFEESAIVAFLFLFGAYLEQRTLAKTRSAIKELVEMVPETALRQTADGDFEEVDLDDLDEGDILLVKTGGKIPVDGEVVSGSGTANEASITGESMPLGKKPGDPVYAGTILENGTIRIKAEKVGDETTFGKIIELVEEAQDSKSQAERLIDRFSKYYTPVVLLLAIIVGLISQDLELAVTILVLGCPGALVIGVPVSNVAGIGNGAKQGILFKGSEVITKFSKVDTIMFDKTGTLTYGDPRVSQVKKYGQGQLAEQLLVSVEKESAHPLAKAITGYYEDLEAKEVEASQVLQGGGIVAQVAGQQVLVGNRYLLDQYHVPVTKEMEKDMEELASAGNSLVLVAVNGQLELALGLKDEIRAGVKEDLAALKKLGVKNLLLLSGDNQKTVDLVAEELGLTEAYGQLLPEDKAEFVKKRQAAGEIVAFVGDGINDSPSLARADIGIAMGSGTDVAIETSNVVLMNGSFDRIPRALALAKATRRNMIENITIALAVVAVLLVSVLASSWMNMAIGMFVHEGSILVVILNAMRLLAYRSKLQKSRKLIENNFSQATGPYTKGSESIQ